jgi:hypothetical protein
MIKTTLKIHISVIIVYLNFNVMNKKEFIIVFIVILTFALSAVSKIVNIYNDNYLFNFKLI